VARSESSSTSAWGDEGGSTWGSTLAPKRIPSLPSVDLAGLVLVVLLAAIAMAPSLRGTLLPGDDEYFIRNYSLVNHPSLTNLILLFKVVHRDLYQPVPMASFAVDTVIYGDRVWGFHLTNVVWHVIAAVMVWTLVRLRWQDALFATVAGALFAVHPQAVEPAATLTARIVLMGATFSLAALIAFLVWSRQPKGEGGWLAAAVLFTCLGMMSKVQVGLPVLLLVTVYGQQKRRPAEWWAAWGVLTLISVIFAGLAVYTTAGTGLTEAARTHLPGPLWGRALMGMGLYLVHYLMPIRLSTWYLPPREWAWSQPLIALGAAGLLLLAGLIYVCYRRGARTAAVGLTWYLMGILPFLGASAARNLIAADRYTYLANIGMHIVVAAGFTILLRQVAARLGRSAAVAVAVGIGLPLVMVLISLTWIHIGHYRTGLAYYTRVAELYPEAPWVHLDVGWELARTGHLEEAERAAHKEMSARQGDRARAEQLLGWIAQERGQLDVAERHYRSAIALRPDETLAHYRLARLLKQAGRNDQAVAAYKKTLELFPGDLPSLIDLGDLYARMRRHDLAAVYLRRALAISPQHVEAMVSLANILLEGGARSEAERLFRRALEANPNHPSAHTNLAVLLAESGRQSEALAHYNEALELEPRLLAARLNRAALYEQAGRHEEAAREYGDALSMEPGCLPALEALHEILVKVFPDDGAARAIGIWEKAAQRAGPQPRILAGLAWAQVLAGLDPQAETTARKALERAPEGQQALAHLTLALVALHRNQVDAALHAMEQATTQPGSTVMEDLVRAGRAVGEYGTEHPQEPLPYLLAGKILLAQGRTTLATRTFEEMMQTTKDPVWADRVKRAMDVWQATSRPAARSQPTSTRAAVRSSATTRAGGAIR
jgi:protein O-mannosyl-transferase